MMHILRRIFFFSYSIITDNTVKELLSYLVQRMVEISQKLIENLDSEVSMSTLYRF